MTTKERAYYKAFAKLNQSIIEWQGAEIDDWIWMDKDEAPNIKLKQIKYTKQEAETWRYILKLIENDRNTNETFSGFNSK
jgi:hypothetical protein